MLNSRSCRSCLKCKHGNYCKQLWCTTSRWVIKDIPILDTTYYFEQLDDKKLIEKLLDKIEQLETTVEEKLKYV